MFTISLYIFTTAALIFSWKKDKKKTKMALKKAWKSFENILPQLIAVLFFIGLALSFLTPEIISQFMGKDSGVIETFLIGVLGSITLIPGFVAFPLVAALFEKGAGVTQISIFVSTLMMVGIATLPVEIKFFGKKIAFLRNGIAFVFAFLIGIIMGGIL